MVSPCSINMSPLWGFGYLLYAVFYKHVAPLGLNAAELAARYRSWGRGYLARWVGEPNPYGYSFGCSRSNFRASRILVRHAAPLGLNAAELAARYRSWGRGFLAQRVGEPNPYGYSFGCSRSNFRASRILVGHAAPLGLNAAEFAARYRSWGRGYLAQRVGEPNPYGYSFGCSRSNFCASRILVRPVAPLGLNAAELAARYPSWGRGFLAQRVGEPNPYGCSFGCSRSNFRASRILVGHAAPLGLNAAEFAARYRLWGRGYLAQRVGEPNPYAYSFGCSRSNFRASRILVGHAAPLGLNAAELAARYRLWGRGFLARRVGEPNPYGCSFGCSRHVPVSWCDIRPSGAKCLTFLPFLLLPPPCPLASLR